MPPFTEAEMVEMREHCMETYLRRDRVWRASVRFVLWYTKAYTDRMGVSRLKSIDLTHVDRLAAPRISEYLMLDPMLTIQATELHFKDQRDHFQWRRMFCNLPEWAHRLDVFPVDRVTLERAHGDDRSEGVPDVFCIVFYGASKEVRVFPTRTLRH